ncbi:YwdI family protein [Sporosarcina sp. BP05]|uniref:YwdI family protein n=1 Tax=Sporosarcina sp. BP05 TaxID=2758726 RepID=UPI001646FADB
MIPYDRIISEMERQLSVARRTNEDSTMREAFAAVRSLCEVALGGESKREEKIVPKMLTTASAVQSITSLDGKLLEEEDANGGSLFDF